MNHFCTQCGSALSADARFCAHCGAAIAKPAVTADGRGPSWAFPAIPQRDIGAFDRTFGIGFILAGVFVTLMCLSLVPMVMGTPNKDSGVFLFFWVPLLGPGFIWGGVASLKSARRQKETSAQLAATGTRCWGRITSTTSGGSARRSGVYRWIELKIVVDGYAADTGEPLTKELLIHWYVSELQMSLAQPGHWCAYLWSKDSGAVDLIGFANADGKFSAAT